MMSSPVQTAIEHALRESHADRQSRKTIIKWAQLFCCGRSHRNDGATATIIQASEALHAVSHISFLSSKAYTYLLSFLSFLCMFPDHIFCSMTEAHLRREKRETYLCYSFIPGCVQSPSLFYPWLQSQQKGCFSRYGQHSTM